MTEPAERSMEDEDYEEFLATPSGRETHEALRSRVNVARAVAAARIAQGWTQEELARRAGTTQARISTLESLGGNLRFDTLDRVARELGLTVTLTQRTP